MLSTGSAAWFEARFGAKDAVSARRLVRIAAAGVIKQRYIYTPKTTSQGKTEVSAANPICNISTQTSQMQEMLETTLACNSQ